MVVNLVDLKHFESQTATNGATDRERDERVREEREREFYVLSVHTKQVKIET